MIVTRSVLVELEGPGGTLVVVLAALLVVLALGVAIVLVDRQHLHKYLELISVHTTGFLSMVGQSASMFQVHLYGVSSDRDDGELSLRTRSCPEDRV